MTDEPKTCEQCAAWDLIEPLTFCSMGWCRKKNHKVDSDSPACEHYEEFKEE